jgi:hypothetical protein
VEMKALSTELKEESQKKQGQIHLPFDSPRIPLGKNTLTPLSEHSKMQEVKETTGLKLDKEKARVDLVDFEFVEGLGHVLGFGAKKYAAHNWRGGIHFSRLLGAAIRHIGALNKGEDVDPESGLPHVHHLGCCVMFLSWMMKHRPDLDDRYKYGSSS